ncbi:hypothetical protein J6590_068512 [Homalodisca vitripennis]|nr:hypothetical protein J6590_068512 [Homalodisca vitripennis]
MKGTLNLFSANSNHILPSQLVIRKTPSRSRELSHPPHVPYHSPHSNLRCLLRAREPPQLPFLTFLHSNLRDITKIIGADVTLEHPREQESLPLPLPFLTFLHSNLRDITTIIGADVTLGHPREQESLPLPLPFLTFLHSNLRDITTIIGADAILKAPREQ